jgi:hypothetical protein
LLLLSGKDGLIAGATITQGVCTDSIIAFIFSGTDFQYGSLGPKTRLAGKCRKPFSHAS